MDRNDDMKIFLIDLEERKLKAQLKAIRELKKSYEKVKGDTQDKRMSQVDIVYNILKNKREPLHITEIITIAKENYDAHISRESIVSSLIKKVNASDRFMKTGKNIFGLIEDRALYTQTS